GTGIPLCMHEQLPVSDKERAASWATTITCHKKKEKYPPCSLTVQNFQPNDLACSSPLSKHGILPDSWLSSNMPVVSVRG
ncbi:hypothetical protein CEXT_643701, partial [Caerostris extrusa]